MLVFGVMECGFGRCGCMLILLHGLYFSIADLEGMWMVFGAMGVVEIDGNVKDEMRMDVYCQILVQDWANSG